LIIDYRSELVPADVHADLCIIGAGAAGLAIARTFLGSPMQVCIVESGGMEADARCQTLYEGSSIGEHPFDPATSRMRVFGGSCRIWGGGCIPFGHLGTRDWVGDSGWPFGYEELRPHYERAREFCRIEAHEFDPDSFLTPPAHPPLAFDPTLLVNRVFAFSPTLFGPAYRSEFEQAPNIRVLLHANVLEFESSPCGTLVRRARIATLDGRRGTVTASHYVLACGGIENARLLLLSDSTVPAGLGNRHDLVGRYFMDHPSGRIGALHVRAPEKLVRPYGRIHGRTPLPAFPEISLSPEAQRTQRILDARVRPFAMEGAVPRGILALREFRAARRRRTLSESDALAERLCARRNGEPPSGPGAPGDGLLRIGLRVALGAGDIALAFLRRLRQRPTVASDHVALVGYFEQQPNRDSRVLLGDDLDPLGQRRVCIDWRLTELDRRSFRTAARIFGGELSRACNGRFEPAPWVEDEAAPPGVYGTSHHLGTTRMDDDPTRGVVDRDCRVHGVDNLYVAGSSVFPTGGWSFPTFTLVALSLRLAEHLRARLRRDAAATSVAA
jgi:choline dehydrogenase-like flavoprotein